MLNRDILLQIKSAYSAGFRKCMELNGDIKPFLSLKQAHEMYGRKTVERWINEGLVDLIKDGPNNCKCRINREQIEMVANASNRNSWFENNANKIKP